MQRLIQKFRRFWAQADGQAMAEYGLLLVLIVIGVMVAMTFFRDQLVSVFNRAGNALR